MERNGNPNRHIEAFAAQLEGARYRRGITKRELARRTGIPENTLRRYLVGERDVPVTSAVAIASALEVDLAGLIDAALAAVRSQELEGLPSADTKGDG